MPGKSPRPVAVLIGAGLRGRRRGGLAVTFVVLLLSAFGLGAGLIATTHGNERVDQLAARTAVADVVAWSAGGRSLPGIETFPGVTKAVGPLPTTDAQLVRGGGHDPVDLQVTGLADPSVPVNHPVLAGGRWATGPGEIVLERSLAAELGLRPGSAVQLRGPSGLVRFRVAGTAYELTDCTYPQCSQGRAFADPAGVGRLGPVATGTYWLAVHGSSERTADQLLARYGKGLEGVNTWPDTRGDLTTVNDIFGRFVSVFGVFLLVACAIVVAGSTGTRMVERRREIGLYGAVGFTRGQVVAGLIGEDVVLGLAASVLAWGLAGFLVPVLTPAGAPLGRSSAVWPVTDLLVTAAIVAVVLVASNIVAAWRAGRRPLPELLSDAPPVTTGRLSRFTGGVPRRLALLGVGAALARPVRVGLTGLAVTVAVVGAIVASGFVGSMTQALDRPARTGDPWAVEVTPAAGSSGSSGSAGSAGPAGSAAKVEAALRADRSVTGWYTETDRPASYRDQTFRARALGGTPRYELGAGRMPTAPGEVIVGYKMTKDLGMTVGSSVPVRIDGKPFTGHVVGWYRVTEDSGDMFAFRLDDLRRLDPAAGPENYKLTLVPGASADGTAARLRSALGSAADVSAPAAGVGGLGAFKAAEWLVAALVGVVALAHLMASLLTGNAENARATGVGQALGFTPRQVTAQPAAAAAVTGLGAAVVGVPVGLVLFRLLSNLVTVGIGLGPGFAALPAAWSVTLIALAAPVLCGVLGAEAGRRAARRPVSEALRWE